MKSGTRIARATLAAAGAWLPVLALSILSASSALVGCGGDAGSAPADTVPATGQCSVAVSQHADEGAAHTAPCAPVAYNTNPPTSGTHYSEWAAYKSYADPVPDGFLVHSLEHGALVIGYDCPEGCADEVDAVRAWMDRLPGDPLCAGARPKIVLAPDPDLPVRWAAAAWNWSWKAPCPDTLTLSRFFRDHYGKTVEAGVCAEGSDYSATGWCPAAE